MDQEEITSEEPKETKTDYIKAFNSNKGKDDNKKKKIIDVAKEVAEFSLMPGLSNIVRSELPVKITWLACQLCLLGVYFSHLLVFSENFHFNLNNKAWFSILSCAI